MPREIAGVCDRVCAISLGHPIAASGTRLALTMAEELQGRGKRYGLATLCIGGGQGQAMILEAA